jgi:hypothetical protein
LPVFKGVIALAIALLNFSNLPAADSMLVSEHFAVQRLREINRAEVEYLSNFGDRWGNISDPVRKDLLDSRFEQPSIQNYTYELVLGQNDYIVTATPSGPLSAQGCWGYYSKEDALIRYSKDPRIAPPGLAGMPLQR